MAFLPRLASRGMNARDSLRRERTNIAAGIHRSTANASCSTALVLARRPGPIQRTAGRCLRATSRSIPGFDLKTTQRIPANHGVVRFAARPWILMTRKCSGRTSKLEMRAITFCWTAWPPREPRRASLGLLPDCRRAALDGVDRLRFFYVLAVILHYIT